MDDNEGKHEAKKESLRRYDVLLLRARAGSTPVGPKGCAVEVWKNSGAVVQFGLSTLKFGPSIPDMVLSPCATNSKYSIRSAPSVLRHFLRGPNRHRSRLALQFRFFRMGKYWPVTAAQNVSRGRYSSLDHDEVVFKRLQAVPNGRCHMHKKYSPDDAVASPWRAIVFRTL
jgi:hypothetical protein